MMIGSASVKVGFKLERQAAKRDEKCNVFKDVPSYK